MRTRRRDRAMRRVLCVAYGDAGRYLPRADAPPGRCDRCQTGPRTIECQRTYRVLCADCYDATRVERRRPMRTHDGAPLHHAAERMGITYEAISERLRRAGA